MSSATSKIGHARLGSLPPAFSTRDSCRSWLDGQVRDRPEQLLVELERQLGRLNSHRLAAPERFAILELLRQPTLAALATNRRTFVDRPLPLRPVEQEALDSSLATLGALAAGYLHCVEACSGKEPGTEGLLAVAAQRALATLAELQLDCYRSNHDVDESHWLGVHRAFAATQAAGQERTAVADALRHSRASPSPLAAWGECLLLHLASLQEIPARQVESVARWAQRWAGKLELRTEPGLPSGAAPLFVDIASDQPAGYRSRGGSGQRVLDTQQLKRSLKKRILALDAGQSPAEIGLGEDCEPSLVRGLLVQTYNRWCKGGAARRHERRNAGGSCAVGGGLEAAHFHISGGMALERPDRTLSDEEIRRQREEMAVFGRILSAPGSSGSNRPAPEARQIAPLETWQLIDQSATGLRLVRPARQAGQRFSGKQLVAVRSPDMKALHLGTVRRATVDADGALHAGVRIFPGEPAPVMVRGTGVNDLRNKFVPAFFLPEVAPLGESASVILPSGWFKRERILEVSPGRGTIRLTGLVERGSDYERATYDVPPPAPAKA